MQIHRVINTTEKLTKSILKDEEKEENILHTEKVNEERATVCRLQVEERKKKHFLSTN